MITFHAGENRDITVQGGKITMDSGIYAVMQSCDDAMRTVRGECPLNPTLGMPNFENIWSGTPNLAQFETAARVRLLDVPNVTAIQSFTASVSQNVLSYTVVIETAFGTGTLNG